MFAGWHADRRALFTPPIACPCTPELLCKTDTRNGILNEACDYPGNMTHVMAAPLYSVDGGAGVIISAGLMRSLDLEAMRTCVTTSHAAAGDHIFTYCLWRQGCASANTHPPPPPSLSGSTQTPPALVMIHDL